MFGGMSLTTGWDRVLLVSFRSFVVAVSILRHSGQCYACALCVFILHSRNGMVRCGSSIWHGECLRPSDVAQKYMYTYYAS